MSAAPRVRDRSDEHYQPIDVVLSKPRIRLLRAMRWLDWSDMTDILIACGGSYSDVEQNTMGKCLGALVASGLLERRGNARAYDYRLTAAGVMAAREVAQLKASEKCEP